jgi:hypothetical protein
MDIEELKRLSEQSERLRREDDIDKVIQSRDLLDEITKYENPHLDQRERMIKSIAGSVALQPNVIESVNERVHKLVKELSDLQVPNFVDSRLFDTLNNANLNFVKSIDKIDHILKSTSNLSAVLGVRAETWMSFQERIAPKIELAESLNSRLLAMMEQSLIAQNSIANIDFNKFNSFTNVTDKILGNFRNGILDFTDSYNNLLESLSERRSSIFELPPSIIEFPTYEMLGNVDLIGSITDEDNENREQDQEIQIIVTDSLEVYLKEINPNLVNLRVGAKEAFTSNNPDKIRHCVTSLRELVREVIQYLSPEDSIKSWSQSEEDYSNGRPTRKARLRFITRHINHGKFIKFVEQDLKATSLAIDLFNAGTHQVKSKLTENQVSALIAKVETSLLFLLEIANSKND